ncbi:hypothetical protein PHYSODRAFT_497140 [Phytophthora sojae]|uniref:Uncharacterized protein n=1 Tax=Phytophthora sojae (strain P6497) TaxID=1094619 RepID=G4Z4V4_PHYSP|nr:hypothetical protein PHYSODRAFT_497140 [Phytophthora sojae]EGZ22283.1 hypothetical protein PHYSODRAFT_497140 [Phytophthora sojae]|eukprot:XP_009525000.1 hypothetical protein PHYSODRAFT_497140 [Phytophthora sojae]
MEKREETLLQDLAVILFSMLFSITLPRNLNEFRSQYLGCRDSKFVFKYRINCKSQQRLSQANAICVSSSDTFAIMLAGDNVFDEMWSCRVSSKNLLVCINRRYSPVSI